MRVACLLVLDLPVAATLRAHPELRGAPLVVVSEPGPGARVLSLSKEAAARGVRLGRTLASARSVCSALRSRVSSPALEGSARDALLDVALSAAPRVRRAAPLAGLAAREAAVFLDATGLRHTFRSEAGLAAALGERARRAGLPACIGVAASQELAHLAARAGALRAPHSPGVATLVAPGEERRFLDPLPVDAVHPSDALATALTRFGVHRLGALLALPRHTLATRLSPEALALVRALCGEGREPPLRAPCARRLEEAVDCEAPLDRIESCLFVLRGMLSRLLDRLALRGLACPALQVSLRLENGARETREFALAAPTTDLRVLLRRAHTALESAPPPAAIESIRVSTEGVPPRRDQLDLFRPPSPPAAEIDALLAELESLCGPERVGRPALANDYRPGRVALAPFRHETPTDPPPDDATRARPALPLALRNLRPPIPARVRLRRGQPWALESALASGEIRHCAGPWRTTGSWWKRDERFAFDHFDVATESGFLLRLRYDHVSRSWQIDAVYD